MTLETRKKILIVGDKDPLEKWMPFAEMFIQKGYSVVLLFFYLNQKAVLDTFINPELRHLVLVQGKQGPVPSASEITETEDDLQIPSMRNFVFTECVLYERSYAETSAETVGLTRKIKEAIDFSEFSFILQNQGAGLIRRICYFLGKKANVPSIYFDVNWFPERMFLQANEMNIVDEFRALPFSECPGKSIEMIKAFAEDKRMQKSAYTYAFDKPGPGGFLKFARKVGSIKNKSLRKSLFYRKRRLKKKIRSFLIDFIFDKTNAAHLPVDRQFFYFPLHYPKDSQITLRNQQYLRQDMLIEFISWNMPHGVDLVVKPHPQAKGDYTYNELSSIRRLENCVLLPSGFSSHDILASKNCRGVITLNSSVGFECLLYYKPVIALSDFYGIDYPPCVNRIQPKDAADTIRRVLQKENREEDFLAALYSIYAATYPGSFFVREIDYEKVCESILSKIESL